MKMNILVAVIIFYDREAVPLSRSTGRAQPQSHSDTTWQGIFANFLG